MGSSEEGGGETKEGEETKGGREDALAETSPSGKLVVADGCRHAEF